MNRSEVVNPGAGPPPPGGRDRPIRLDYVPQPSILNPRLTRWQGAAVVLFVLSFPLLLVLLWLLPTLMGR